MRRYELIKEICDCMLAIGWKPYQNDHEDANGQFEMNWDYSDSLVTAIGMYSLSIWLKFGRKTWFKSNIHAKTFS